MQNTQVINWSDTLSGSSSNQTDNHLVRNHSSSWTPTMKLRWKKTVVSDDFSATQKNELQQLWTGNLGEQEWRPIDIIE